MTWGSVASSRIRYSYEKYVLKILLLIEGILLVIVCSGFLDFKTHRKTSFAIENLHYATQPKLIGWNDERLVRKTDETDMEYATRMNKVVGSSFYHCLRSSQENVFEMVAFRFSKTCQRFGFLQPSRYCGFCHQAAYILTKVLNTQGIDAYPLEMHGHVCVLMKDGNKEYIFDPDYVVGPMLYQDDMTVYIPKLYGAHPSYRPLYPPFSTNKDDNKFYTMEILRGAEEEQNIILEIMKFIYYLCVVFLILNTLLIIKQLTFSRQHGA